MSFNAKQALQRIRQNKNSKPAQDKSLNLDGSNVEPLILDDSKISEVKGISRSNQTQPIQTVQVNSSVSELARKVQNLEKITRDLTHQLMHSNQAVEKLRREKSHLETQVLKLEFENTQMKNSNKVFRQLKPIKQSPEKQPQKIKEGVNLSKSKLHLSAIVPQDVLDPVRNEPIDSLLQKKEKHFRALKNSSRGDLIRSGNKQLSQLSKIMKQYPEMEKPVIVISVNEGDFQ